MGNDLPARTEGSGLVPLIRFFNAILAKPITAGPRFPLAMRNIATRRASAVVVVNAIAHGLFILIDGIECRYFWHGKSS